MATTNTFDDANQAFFADFMKCVSSEAEEPAATDNKVCLITDEPLGKYAIRLNCGHSFNYLPLSQSIWQYKLDQQKNSGNLYRATHCPYCREKTDGLLPYVPISEKMHGVNMPHQHSFGENVCDHMMTKKKVCGRKCYFDKCYLHLESYVPVIRPCEGVTKAGTPCKNKASGSEKFCKLHLK